MSFVAKLFTPARLTDTEGYKSSHGFHEKNIFLKSVSSVAKLFTPPGSPILRAIKAATDSTEKNIF